MKLFNLLFIFASIAACLAVYSTADEEIFHLQSLLNQYSPDSNSFYDLLDLPKSATSKAISKKFKKLTLKYHPDKNGGENEYYEFLQLAATVLRDGNKREVYDYYLKSGFPRFTSKGWGFSRFKPSTVFILVFLVVIVHIFHYVALWISYKANVGRIKRLVSEIKSLDKNPMDFKNKRVFHPGVNKEFEIRVDGIYLVEKSGNWDDVKEKFVPVESGSIDTPEWRDMLVVKWWNATLGRIPFFKVVKPERKRESKVNTASNQQPKKKGKKVARKLPNGKIVYKYE